MGVDLPYILCVRGYRSVSGIPKPGIGIFGVL